MKWITREKVKVDRVACPWLIKNFVDLQAEFLFVPADRVAVLKKNSVQLLTTLKAVSWGITARTFRSIRY